MSGFPFNVRVKMLVLAVALAGLWYLAAPASVTPQERHLWEKVRAAQLHLAEWRKENGTASEAGSDPWDCGLIGVEWSGITTTLGDLGAKRTACNPAWAIRFGRWYRDQGLEKGDHIAIYSSGSFPGLLLSALAAAEAMELEPLVVVSLGASTWGANHPEVPWPALAAELRRAGFISKRADYYTLGGDEEIGQGMPPEGEDLLRRTAEDAGVQMLEARNLEAMIDSKSRLLARFGTVMMVNIGGSHANMGSDPVVLNLQPGLVSAGESANAGNGVIGFAVRGGIPVIHMLNLRALSGQTGIPYDSAPHRMAPSETNAWWSLLGVILFFGVVFTHKRWKLGTVE